MDSSNSQRNKRTANRPSRGSEDPTPVAEPKENAECTNVAALPISSQTPAIIPVSECRRSSRKKIIKFDVRDLLNKNRKPHKIQIEARIDSNVPSTSKTTAASGETTSKVGPGLTPGASGDLSSKQKTFMEKSAIFRRYSISQEQTKPPPPPIPPMPPTILGKVVGEKDAAISTDISGKRINRTQEYYNNVILKPKQTTSLIVAQMESNVRSVDVKQRKSCNKATSGCDAKTEEMQHIITQQKRRGRPPKTRQQEIALTDAASREENSTGEASHKITPEKATNWKEYKACLAQQTDNKDATKETSETNKEALAITPNVNTQDSELESVVVIQTENKIIVETEDPNQTESKIFQEETLIQLAKSYKKVNYSESSQSKKESPVSEINEEQTGDHKEATECAYRIDKYISENVPQSLKESNKKIEDVADAKSASTDDKNDDKSTQILSRESSLSESENSVGSPSLKSTENLSSESSLSKEIVSPQYSPINKNEERKMPAAKRSKRLQRKNKRVENDKDAISYDTSECSEKLQINKNEYSSKPENEIKTSNCLNIQLTNGIISAAEESKDSTKEILESNLSLLSDNSNSVSSKESTVEHFEHPSEQMDENSSSDYKQSTIGKASENVNEKREDLDMCLEVLDKKVSANSNLPTTANKHLDDQCQSIDHQTFHEMDKKESNVTFTSPLISEETLDKSCGSIEQLSQKFDADEDISNQSTSNQSKENVVQTFSDEEQILALEVPKNELKDNQKQLTSKTKLKSSFKQRKSLRKRKESNKYDSHTNIHDQEGENKETEVVMKQMDETPLEKVLPSCSPELSLRNRKESNKLETHSESEGNLKQCEVVSEKTEETLKLVKEIKYSASPKPALISEQEIEVQTLDETSAELRVEPIQEVVSNSTSVVAMDDGLDVGTNPTNIVSNIEMHTDSKSNIEVIEQEKLLKSKNCPEKLTLAKRKSLRIQKDLSNENVDKESKNIPVEDVTAENTPKDKSSIPATNISIVDVSANVPKRKPRKSRFRNLHGPEDTETEVKNIVDKPNIINEESPVGVIKNVVDKPKIISKESTQSEETKNNADMPLNIINEESPQVEEIKNVVDIPANIINEESSQVGEIENILNIPKLIIEESAQMGQTENIFDKPDKINEESPQALEIKSIVDMQPNIINEKSPQVEEIKNIVDIPLNIINEESPHGNIVDSPKLKIDESSQMGQTENIFDKLNIINAESPQVEENKNIDDNPDAINKQSPQEEESERIDEQLDEEINKHKKSNSPPIIKNTICIEKSTFENVNKNDDIEDDQLDRIYSKNVQTPSPSTTSPTESNTNTYVIQNVSIETNTLLDILRTVQSNKEAAQAEAQKSTHDTELSVSSPVVCNNSNEDDLKDSQLKKLSDSNTNSPNRSKSASPLTHKKVQQRSPCRSDTSSPSTLKKVNISPCRSDTSSPLTFNKKVTRRYERRSKRGDEDSTHKTLEETFAEIAALSSKAVLEMTTNEMTDTAATTNKPSEDEILIPVCERELILEDNKDKEMVESEFEPLPERKTEESIETTPTRKTRQPKRRSTKVSSPMAVTDTDIQEHVTHQIGKESEDPALHRESSIIASDKSVVSESMVKENISASLSASNTQTTASDSHIEVVVQETVGRIIYEPQVCGEINKALIPEDKLEGYNTANIVQDEKTQNQPSPVEESTQMGTTNIEEEPQTPKQTPKRDSSLAKNETKGSNRKSTKKSKPTTVEQLETKALEDKEIITKTSNTPPKKGRRAKTATPPQDQPNPSIAASSSGGKKKLTNKEQTVAKEEMEELQQQIQNDVGNDSVFSEIGLHEKSFDEKMAKKKRQRKLKEAFEAALNDKPVDTKQHETLTPSPSPIFGLSFLNKSPPTTAEMETNSINSGSTSPPAATTAVPEPEEDPDPLKDIEKFIEDGVNLLKKDYKIDEDSVDNIIPTKPLEEPKNIQHGIEQITEDNLSNKDEEIFNTFETPADTPLATPSATPPPPETPATPGDEEQTSGGVRRSHRIKLITKMPKALVGRGLVRDKERFSIKDDVETKSHYTLDDHLLDLAEVEAKNAKFLKEMEERLSNFQVIKENEYKCERVISREARKMICDCFLTAEEEERGELACGEDCLNRLLMIECGNECNIKERCTNKRFQKFLCSPCRVFRTEKKGFGIMADIEILPGEFIMEYVGEVIDTEEFEKRRIAYSQEKNRHYYFMALRSDAIIDATIKGNISRFINHSCDPNAETQKWTVNGELRIGFFSRKSIMPGEEITFDYQYQRYGREAQRCYCESSNCRGWIGQEPNSDEGEQIDDEDESDDEEEDEEDTTSNLLEDDEDSDASVSDPEEVQKKLEMAAAQAEVELAPIALDDKVTEKESIIIQEPSKELEESVKPEAEEDSKSKFKKLLSKMAEKVAAKHKQTKREQKLQRKKKSKESSAELANKQKSLEDPDIEDEVEFLSRCGLKTQSDTLRLSRLMVRAKLVQTRLNLLNILRKGELPCRRLFLDYHGLRLVHGWMSEDAGNMQIRLALLQTLELLPIANKTVLTDSKVMQVVRNWCGSSTALSPNDDSQSSSNNSQDGTTQSINSGVNIQENTDCIELQKLALKLITTWDGLPEIFRIPKKERIEQMKEHEREADRQYAETEGDRYSSDQYRTNRFGRRLNTTTTSRFAKPHNTNPNSKLQQQNMGGNAMRTPNVTPENAKCLSKTQRREMFAAKVARDEAEKRMAEERREFETKCRFFGLDPKKTRPQDVPFCVNPATGQWYSVERKPITTPPSYAHVQVPVKPKSTNPVDYQLPSVCSTLPPQWKFAITPLGQIYYYHVQYRIPQWEPPSPAQLQLCLESNIDDGDSGNEHTPTTGPDSSDDDDDILIGMDAAQLKAYIDRKVEMRRQKRYQRLVDERAISPRREEDRMYNQMEVRKYKENKEKIRKRKEEIRRKRAEALRQSSLNMCTLGSLSDTISGTLKVETDEDMAGVLPIQDYLLSSDEDEDIKAEINSPLIDKIVEGDKIVDELDALTTKRPLKRPLPSHRDLNEPSTSSSSAAAAAAAATIANERQEYKKRKMEKKEKRKPKEQDAKYRKTKEKFRCEIAGIIVHHLRPYRKDSCTVGRIKSNEDFNHLARKLTHFVMIKELKYCESVGQTLVVTESVKNKSREFIKKYMAKYADVYVKPANDPEFKDIPFTL